MYYPVSRVMKRLAFISFFRNCRLLASEGSGLVAGNLKSWSVTEQVWFKKTTSVKWVQSAKEKFLTVLLFPSLQFHCWWLSSCKERTLGRMGRGEIFILFCSFKNLLVSQSSRGIYFSFGAQNWFLQHEQFFWLCSKNWRTKKHLSSESYFSV